MDRDFVMIFLEISSERSQYYKLIYEYAQQYPSYLDFLINGMKFKSLKELENYFEGEKKW